MTTLLPAPTTASDDDLSGALVALAAAAEQARDDVRTRAVLAAVVERLEHAAGADLGDTAVDPLVVLQRRFGRAHALLARRLGTAVEPDLLRGLAAAVMAPDDPRSSVLRRTPRCAVPATC